MKKQPMMQCGHRANGTENTIQPVCVICAGINKGYNKIAEEPDLTNRKCKCSVCNKIVPSKEAVALFEYRPKEKYDSHYDGCRGWE